MSHRRNLLLALSASAICLGTLLIGGATWLHQSRVAAATESKYQQLMALTSLNNLSAIAPDFKLTDQNGRTVTLSSLRGKAVVLEFMDPACTDICPIVSQEIIRANRLLGTKASQVVFLAVNVNQFHESKADVMAFSKEQGLNHLSNWHFLTGKTQMLQAIWKAYGIQVIPNPTGDVQHSSFMYFIKPNGSEAYVANPDNSKATIPAWGQGIQYVVTQTL